jgi:hypothetical protein
MATAPNPFTRPSSLLRLAAIGFAFTAAACSGTQPEATTPTDAPQETSATNPATTSVAEQTGNNSTYDDSVVIATLLDANSEPVAVAAAAETDRALYPVVDIVVDEAQRCTGAPIAGTDMVITSVDCAGGLTAVSYLTQARADSRSQDGGQISVLDVFISEQADIAVLRTDHTFDQGYTLAPSGKNVTAVVLQDVIVDGRLLPPGAEAPETCTVYDCSAEPEVRRWRERVQTVRYRWPVTCTIGAAADCTFAPGADGGAALDADGNLAGIVVLDGTSHRVAAIGELGNVADVMADTDDASASATVLRNALR